MKRGERDYAQQKNDAEKHRDAQISGCHILTLQAFVDEHPKPPPPLHGSLNEIFTGTLRVFVNDVAAVTYAVGGIVSA